MTDRYQQLVNPPIGKLVTKQIGLPQPSHLERYEPNQPVITGPVLLGAASGSRLAKPVTKVLKAVDANVFTPMDEALRAAAAQVKLDAGIFNADAASPEDRFRALVFDATGISSSEELDEAWAFFRAAIRRVLPSGRGVVLGNPPAGGGAPEGAIPHRALEGLVRAIGKE